MNAVWLRLIYILEFLVALPAVFTVWSQVGGQGHLDLMPWYWKLVLVLLACLTVVRFSAAVIEREHFWTGKSVVWAVMVLVVATAMGLATFYYHLHEAPEDLDPEESTTATTVWSHPRI